MPATLRLSTDVKACFSNTPKNAATKETQSVPVEQCFIQSSLCTCWRAQLHCSTARHPTAGLFEGSWKTVVRNSRPRPTVAIETGHMYTAPHMPPPQISRHPVIFYCLHWSSAGGKNRTVSGHPYFIENSHILQYIASTTIVLRPSSF